MWMCRPRTWVLSLATSVLVACATASPQGNGGSADAREPDAHFGGRPDGPPVPDAPPGTPDARPDAMVNLPDAMTTGGTVTLSQASSTSIVVGNSVSCNDGTPFFDTAENSYYRAFQLSDFGVTGTFHSQRVDFAIESATAGSVSQSVSVNLYSYSGATGGASLDTTKMSLVGTANVTVPDTTTGEMLTANIAANVPASGALVAEVFVPDGETIGNSLFIGSNTASETHPGYIRAPACSTPTPTAINTLGLTSQVSIVLSVTGSYP
jgi:hypothetical protein